MKTHSIIMEPKIIRFDTITSTQDYAIDIIKKQSVDKDILVIATVQTNGRGRLGQRIWLSEEGNFHGSYIINIENIGISINNVSIINTQVLISLCKFLQNITNEQAICTKLPNDIYYNNKKLAGVLTEIIYPYAIIGIGINICKSPLNISTSINEIMNGNNKIFDIIYNNIYNRYCIDLYKIIIEDLSNVIKS